jgi:ATP-dependent DNA helicase RecG
MRTRCQTGARQRRKSSSNFHYRNRRIGEFLKELDLTEGRCTGIPTIRAAMAENGSLPPRFSTDDGRTYFIAELPVHPQMPGVGQAHEEAHDELTETEARVLRFVADQPRSRSEIAHHLGLKSRSGYLYKAIDHLRNLGFAALTISDKPQSKNQKLRVTDRGLEWLFENG